MKVTIAEINQFLAEWQTVLGEGEDDWYYDDLPFDPEELQPTDVVELTRNMDGSILYQGNKHDLFGECAYSFYSKFMQWRKRRDSVYVVLEVPKEKFDEFCQYYKSLNIKEVK